MNPNAINFNRNFRDFRSASVRKDIEKLYKTVKCKEILNELCRNCEFSFEEKYCDVIFSLKKIEILKKYNKVRENR